ncbi:hypothetical protein [Luteibacter sp. dw_328]|uniref:hypothetical protein n=1 Tax=Luteibacter sp. dw_328 TaxID=2719796 RepID=UPI001BD6D386|nr:hypothetical protein [Luteibacter sp. dw_328]
MRKLRRVIGAAMLFASGGAVLVAGAPVHASAVDTGRRIDADTPLDPAALSVAEVDAIVAEATEARKASDATPPADPRWGPSIRLPAHWKTLTREKLTALLTMPGFSAIPQGPRSMLVDQAATWDLLTFTRASDSARLWARLWPSPTQMTYDPDPTWGPEAVATQAIIQCFPRPAWTAKDTPIVDVLRNSTGWQWGNVSGPDGFRACIAERGQMWRTPQRVLSDASRLLVQRIGDQLSMDGCNGQRADDCLVLYQAFQSLAPRSERRVALLQRMAPSFSPGQPIALPPPGTALDDAGFANRAHEAIERQAFLTLKLPVVLTLPAAWPAGERARTLMEVMNTTYVLDRLRAMRPQDIRDETLIDPWQWLLGSHAPLADQEWRDLGSTAGRTYDCAFRATSLTRQPATYLPKVFWREFSLGTLSRGLGSCEHLSEAGLDDLIAAKGAERERLMTIFKPFASRFEVGGAERSEAVSAAGDACRKYPGQSVFGLCPAAAKDEADIQAKREEDVVTACADMREATARKLGIAGYGAEGDAKGDCASLPGDDGKMIVVLAHAPSGPASSDHALILDLAMLDVESGDVLAHLRDDDAVPSDEPAVDTITLDTERYLLAPGKRAFGVRLHKVYYRLEGPDEDIALYLLSDGQLRRVLRPTTLATSVRPEDPECPSRSTATDTKLIIDQGKSRGMANIVLRTKTTFEIAGDENPGPACKAPAPSVKERTLRFDGREYQEPKAP